MRHPLRPNLQRQQTAQTISLPAPYRGLNRRDQLQDAEIGYAAVLENFLPTQGEITLRKGYEIHAHGLPDQPIQTLMEYAGGQTRQLFAATGSEIYNVSRQGKVEAPVLSGLKNAQWQHTLYTTTSGQYLLCVNGQDGLRAFNGKVWTNQSLSRLDPLKINNITTHKARLWLVEKNTLNAWYLPTLAIAGAASRINLGALCKKGGTLQAIASWSLDAGDGADDYLVCVSSEGECVVYAGTDPDSAQNWSMVGIYQTDRPIGLRCFVKFGADLLILTESGIISLTALLRSQNRLSSLSELVREDFQIQVTGSRQNPDWQILHYPKKGWLLVNTPAPKSQNIQYVYNALIPPPDGWASFSGLHAHCWATFDGNLFFGEKGRVCQADTGEKDDQQPIKGHVQWSWSKMGTPQKKRFTLARIHMRANKKPATHLALALDYQRKSEETELTLITNLADPAKWDLAKWDQSLWTGKAEAFSQWSGIFGIGHAASLKISTRSTGTFSVIGTEMVFETGGVL